MDEGLAAAIMLRRLWCAFLWLVVLAVGLLGVGLLLPQLVMLALLGGLVTALATIRAGRPSDDERLARPRAYRTAAGALLAVSLGGAAVGLIPDATENAQVLAPYFGIVAIVAYRALLARGPRGAMVAVTVAMLTWMPFGVRVLGACRHPEHIIGWVWTDDASLWAMRIALSLSVLLVAVALVAFRPRTDAMPDARAVRV